MTEPRDIRKTFHDDLADITNQLVAMAALVTDTIPRVTETLLSIDLAEAEAIIEADDVLDALMVEVEESCYRVLALQQPMAGDMRAIVAAIRMVAEIERSGDLAVNIAKATRRIYGVTITPRLRGLIASMGEEAGRLYRLAMQAYAEGDAPMAAALDDLDDRLDALHRDYIAEIFVAHDEEQLTLQEGVQLALIGRYYERIGDHAVNIGERVRYMVTGALPEQQGPDQADEPPASDSDGVPDTPSGPLAGDGADE
ncbi:MAG: phosphate signaling complex protein PhoU [Microthrixaceae bacterium]